MRCVWFYTNDVVTGFAQALGEGADACPKFDQIAGVRRLAHQTGQIIVVVVCAFERSEEIDPGVLTFHDRVPCFSRLKTLYLTIT